MLLRGSTMALAALGLSLSLGVPAMAQRGARGGARGAARGGVRGPRAQGGAKQKKTPIEEFETLPPDQQQKALNRLPPEQRQQLEERLRRFNALPPEQQQTLKTLYNRLHQLPPQRQEAVRKAINKFSQEPPIRQQAMRDELRKMGSLSQDQRQTEMSSPDFRSRFNKKEQDTLRDMSPLLPER